MIVSTVSAHYIRFPNAILRHVSHLSSSIIVLRTCNKKIICYALSGGSKTLQAIFSSYVLSGSIQHWISNFSIFFIEKQSYSAIPAAPENFALSYERSNEDTNTNIYDIHQNEMRSEHDKENLVPGQRQQLELSNVDYNKRYILEYNPPAHKSSHDTKMQESISILLRMRQTSN
ncbi:hypothetical protein ACS0PU_005381 [Formica fusca]